MAGETTSVAASTAFQVPKAQSVGVVAYTFTLAYATGQLELNDVMQAGYLPPNVTVVGAIVKATDMDTSGSPALVQKITVGSTDIVTGITAGQSAANAVYGVTPLTTTDKTLVSVTNTTAAATAAAGTLYVTLLVSNG